MEMLNGVLAIDPEGVIEMAWEVVISGRPHGFNLGLFGHRAGCQDYGINPCGLSSPSRADIALGQILEIIESSLKRDGHRRFG